MIAIALGGMVGLLTPIAILPGGVLAAMAAYSYIKLGTDYKNEGATYSFVARNVRNVIKVMIFPQTILINNRQ